MIFSIIVPFLNEGSYIEQCIQSLLDQDFDISEYEVIFVDNNSTDRSRSIVEKYPRIILLEERTPNVYAARNKALAIAKGEIIAFTDADCAVPGNWLSNIYESMGRDVGIVIGKKSSAKGSTFLCKLYDEYDNSRIDYILTFCDKNKFYGYTNNMAVRKEVFSRIGCFCADCAIFGDGNLVYRCATEEPQFRIRYAEKMAITHLEIHRLADHLEKRLIYSEFDEKRKYLNLSLREHLKIYLYIVKKNKYSFIKISCLFFMVFLGFLVYFYGKHTKR